MSDYTYNTCISCGNAMQGNMLSFGRCPICKMSENTERKSEQAEINRQFDQRMEELRLADLADLRWEENERAKKRQHDALVAAKVAAAKQAQQAQLNARALAESKITLPEAYDFGFKYIDANFGKVGGACVVELAVLESGECAQRHVPPFISAIHNQEFLNGVYERMRAIPMATKDNLMIESKKMGRKIAEYSDKTESFVLPSGIEINGVSIPTKVFRCDFKKVLFAATGEMKMEWTPPFEDRELIDAFLAGLNEGMAEVNTDILKQYRQKREADKVVEKAAAVAATLAKAELVVQNKKKAAPLENMLLYFPIVATVLLWFMTNGMLFFIGLISTLVVELKIFAKYEKAISVPKITDK